MENSKMDTDMFQQILDMVGSAGEGSFWLAIMFIGQVYFEVAMTVLCLLLVVFAFTRLIGQLNYISTLASSAGFNYCGFLDLKERKALHQWIITKAMKFEDRNDNLIRPKNLGS